MSIVPVHHDTRPAPCPPVIPAPAREPEVACDPYNAAPGAVPFPAFLRAINAIDRAAPHRPLGGREDSYEPSPARCPGPAPAPGSGGVATIGEVPEPTRAEVRHRTETDVRTMHRVVSPMGAMIDLRA